jgi:DNA polymerase-3 subunit alpha
LYQEQVLKIAHEIAGFNLEEADLLRRAMSHFDTGKQMHSLKEKFIVGAMSRNNMHESVAVRIWELMSAFAGYGFPKAHAASYAQIAWRIAWCKAHFPPIFMSAVLANWGGYYSQRVYLAEARRMGIEVRAPHINYSRPEFSLTYLDINPVIFMGLNQVRELTHNTQSRIFRNRPFHSLVDFLLRVDPRPIEAKNLILAGALDGFASVPTMLRQIQNNPWKGGQHYLFPSDGLDSRQKDTGAHEDWTLSDMASSQEAVLGISVSAHPLDLVKNQIMNAGTISSLEATGQVGKLVKLAGIRQTWHRYYDKGDPIYIMTLEDLDGMIDIIISANVYHRCRTELKFYGPFIVEGIIEQNPSTNEAEMRATNIWHIEKFH